MLTIWCNQRGRGNVILNIRIIILKYIIVVSNKLKVFNNNIAIQIFGPKRDENEEWLKLHNEKLHSL
jgi:hypothetical protein